MDISMGPGQGMTIGRRLGGSGPIAFGREERGKVSTVGGFDTFCDRLSHKDDGRRPMQLKRYALKSRKLHQKLVFCGHFYMKLKYFSTFVWCLSDHE